MAGKRRDLPGVVAEGPLIVKISIERPYMSFLEVLAMDGLKIVPRAAIEKDGEAAFGRAPVGTGRSAWRPGTPSTSCSKRTPRISATSRSSSA